MFGRQPLASIVYDVESEALLLDFAGSSGGHLLSRAGGRATCRISWMEYGMHFVVGRQILLKLVANLLGAYVPGLKVKATVSG